MLKKEELKVMAAENAVAAAGQADILRALADRLAAKSHDIDLDEEIAQLRNVADVHESNADHVHRRLTNVPVRDVMATGDLPETES